MLTITPGVIIAPLTAASVIARASTAGPFRVSGVICSTSARKPVVWALAMLLAITRCRVIAALMPVTAVQIRRSMDQAQLRRLMTVWDSCVAVSIAFALAWK